MKSKQAVIRSITKRRKIIRVGGCVYGYIDGKKVEIPTNILKKEKDVLTYGIYFKQANKSIVRELTTSRRKAGMAHRKISTVHRLLEQPNNADLILGSIRRGKS